MKLLMENVVVLIYNETIWHLLVPIDAAVILKQDGNRLNLLSLFETTYGLFWQLENCFICISHGFYNPTGGSEDGHSQHRQHKHGLLLDMLHRPS